MEQHSAEGMPTIFIVDDDDNVAGGLTLLLESIGLSAASFNSAELFLADQRDMRSWKCGLVDMHMPGMDGMTLIDLLHAQGAPPPGLLLMTGKPTLEIEQKAAAAGMPAVLNKPLDPGQVMTAVQLALAV